MVSCRPSEALTMTLISPEGASYDDQRYQLVLAAAGNLVEARMIDHDKGSGSFTITDSGRIAAKYYIHHKSIEIFNRTLNTQMTEADVLSMVCLSTEVSDLARPYNATRAITKQLPV
jgi:replicative superfamily II helicase